MRTAKVEVRRGLRACVSCCQRVGGIRDGDPLPGLMQQSGSPQEPA
jgi:hypothetical protein